MKWNPKFTPQNFSCFFITGSGWGSYAQNGSSTSSVNTVSVVYGTVSLQQLVLASKATKATATVDNNPVSITVQSQNGQITVNFTKQITIQSGSVLKIQLSPWWIEALLITLLKPWLLIEKFFQEVNCFSQQEATNKRMEGERQRGGNRQKESPPFLELSSHHWASNFVWCVEYETKHFPLFVIVYFYAICNQKLMIQAMRYRRHLFDLRTTSSFRL